jgi:hypothetical protein
MVIKAHFNIKCKLSYIEIDREMTLKGDMFGDQSSADDMIDIDFSFFNNFMMGYVFVMEPIPKINFPEHNDNINVVRFIPNEEALR